MRNVEGRNGSEDLSRLICEAVELENRRLTAWLETIRDEAAEIRIANMASEALSGNQSIESLKTSPAFIAETAASA